METILVWLGSGFAFAIGVCVGAWAMRATFPAAKDKRNLDDANDLLRERNEIGRREVAALERIAAKIENQGD